MKQADITKMKREIAKLKKERDAHRKKMLAERKARQEAIKLKMELKQLKRNPKFEEFKKKASKAGVGFFKALDRQIAKSKF